MEVQKPMQLGMAATDIQVDVPSSTRQELGNATAVSVTVTNISGWALLENETFDIDAAANSILPRLKFETDTPSRMRLITQSGAIIEETTSSLLKDVLSDDDVVFDSTGVCHCDLQFVQEECPAAPKTDKEEVKDPLYCCIIGETDTLGGSALCCPCCYLGFCGPLTDHEFAVCCGCNFRDARKCRRPSRPICECPCLITCFVWPIIYPIGLCLSWLTCGKLVYAGECGYCCCPCMAAGYATCAGPTYDGSAWYDEDPSCTPCVILL